MTESTPESMEYGYLQKYMNDNCRYEILERSEELLPRERNIISIYFGLSGMPSMTLKDISEVLPITKERVRQIKKAALEKLKNLTYNKQYLSAA